MKDIIIKILKEEVDIKELERRAKKCGYKSVKLYKYNDFKCPSKALIKAKECGYFNIYEFENADWKCPSQVLINARNCGFDNIEDYKNSGWKCTKEKKITGSYTAAGQPHTYDALHSFHRRAKDGFGGRMNSIVKDGIKDYKEESNVDAVDIKNAFVDIDPNTLTVNWEVTIGPSSDGYTYEEFDSRGSAGGGEGAVNGQLESMKSYHPNKEAKLVYHYNETIPVCFNSNGTKMEGGCKGTINMQQKFFKFGKKI
jgi:hypothetical protein